MKMSKLKRQAEILSKECGLTHSKALELASRLNGFKDLHQAQKGTSGETRLLGPSDWKKDAKGGLDKAYIDSGSHDFPELEGFVRIKGEDWEWFLHQDGVQVNVGQANSIEAACTFVDKVALDTIRQASVSDQLEPETEMAKEAIEGLAFPKMKVFASRFPDQGVCGGGMVVVADNYELAKELLRKDLAQDQDQDWHEEILEALEELGPASNAVYSFFT